MRADFSLDRGRKKEEFMVEILLDSVESIRDFFKFLPNERETIKEKLKY